MTKHGLTLEERFWLKVDKRGDDECWEWIKSCSKDGYGMFGITSKHSVGAHRYSYEIHKGPIHGGLFVCHTCDNPPCVNPKHLFLGTNQDNILDAVKKGRLGVGESRSNAKLTEEQVKVIKRLLINGGSVNAIARQYSMSHVTISRIKTGKEWKHVTLDP